MAFKPWLIFAILVVVAAMLIKAAARYTSLSNLAPQNDTSSPFKLASYGYISKCAESNIYYFRCYDLANFFSSACVRSPTVSDLRSCGSKEASLSVSCGWWEMLRRCRDKTRICLPVRQHSRTIHCRQILSATDGTTFDGSLVDLIGDAENEHVAVQYRQCLIDVATVVSRTASCSVDWSELSQVTFGGIDCLAFRPRHHNCHTCHTRDVSCQSRWQQMWLSQYRTWLVGEHSWVSTGVMCSRVFWHQWQVVVQRFARQTRRTKVNYSSLVDLTWTRGLVSWRLLLIVTGLTDIITAAGKTRDDVNWDWHLAMLFFRVGQSTDCLLSGVDLFCV